MDYEILIRFFLAALWGGIVGAEREYRSKSAGFRTMIMISIGSCFFTMMSQYIGSPGNPDRIASNIVTGIGFLGAGVIFRGEFRVNGITTAATIWVVAAVGMGIGAGYYFAAAAASVFVFIVLAILPYCEKWIDQWNQSKTYTIHCRFTGNAKEKFENLYRQYDLKFMTLRESKNEDDLSISWEVQGHVKSHQAFIAVVMNDITVKGFEY